MKLSDYLSDAERAASIIPLVLEQRSLAPAIERYVLANSPRGAVWLFVVLNTSQLDRQERHTSGATLHQISTALKGLPVILSNHNGVRYAVLLSPPPGLPDQIPFPGYRQGLLQIGVDWRGQPAEILWSDVRHILVAGMSRSGKSNLLRLIVSQAANAGHRLILCDPDGQTFPAFNGHPALLTQVASAPPACELCIVRAMEEMAIRQKLYTAAGASVDKLETYNEHAAEPLPLVFVAIDELTALIENAGRAQGALARNIGLLAMGGLKFGIHLVLGGHDWTRDAVGRMGEQMAVRICFQVRKASTSRVVLDRAGAEHIRSRGRALTDPWGLVQCYVCPDLDFPAGDGLTVEERRIVDFLNGHSAGRMTFEALAEIGYGRRPAERLRKDWELRGLAIRAPEEDNALVLASHLRTVVDNRDSE